MNLMEKKTAQKEPAKKTGKPDTEQTEQKRARKAAGTKEKPAAAKTEKSMPAGPAHEVPPTAPVLETSQQSGTAEVGVVAPAGIEPAPARTAEKEPVSGPPLRLRWVRSAIGAPEKQKRIVQGLGFHRIREIITRPDTPMIRGMVAKIPHLVEIVE
jgi:large subunit ribosomal protein L30